MRTLSLTLILVFGMAWATGFVPVVGHGAPSEQLRVLLVTAHPDDDASFAGVVYQITQQLGGIVDLALVTDGSGGFRYSTLAEKVYGVELTDEAVARQYLPTIRKRELMAGRDTCRGDFG